MNQFFRFCIVGTIGFLTDFTVLYLLVNGMDVNPTIGRILSFLVAATVTWKLNRHFTFSKQGSGSLSEWLQYLVLTGFGGGINLLVYQLWITMTDTRTLNLFFAVAAGSAVAMVFNFAISKFAVFNHKPSKHALADDV